MGIFLWFLWFHIAATQNMPAAKVSKFPKNSKICHIPFLGRSGAKERLFLSWGIMRTNAESIFQLEKPLFRKLIDYAIFYIRTFNVLNYFFGFEASMRFYVFLIPWSIIIVVNYNDGIYTKCGILQNIFLFLACSLTFARFDVRRYGVFLLS